MHLAELLLRAAQTSPETCAVVGPDGAATYGELDCRAWQAARLLRAVGVKAGDRVGIYAPKGMRALACMQGALRVGAAYVPIDIRSPAARAAGAFAGCGVSAMAGPAASLREIASLGVLPAQVAFIALDDGLPRMAGWRDVLAQPRKELAVRLGSEDDLAYILYTSGSTGPMKGVCLSHRNALSFVRWAVACVGATAADRFANHAPYNFDLSVFDIYGAFLSRARLVTVPEYCSYLGRQLVELCASQDITIWYSVPTALTLMMEDSRFDAAGLPALRAIVFAGEVFPIDGVRALRRAFPRTRLFNFYGPTETNVCTAYEVHHVPADRVAPVPVGIAASGNTVWAETPDGRPAHPGEEGELLVQGPTVALGYWGRPFAPGVPYRTGDRVRVIADGLFDYRGRLDRMVKIRGFRVEPGEVEAAVATHPGVAEAAVIVRGDGPEARLVAFVAPAPTLAAPPTLLELKTHCAERLPPYMNVAELQLVDRLPRTPNGKIDYRRLATMPASAAAARTVASAPQEGTSCA
jgi:amino acid adenylation domain-containing protein